MADEANPCKECPVAVRAGYGWGVDGWEGGTVSGLSELSLLFGFMDAFVFKGFYSMPDCRTPFWTVLSIGFPGLRVQAAAF